MPNKIARVTVLGSDGFIGKNLIAELKKAEGVTVQPFDISDTEDTLKKCLSNTDFIFNLAGVNRPQKESEFEEGNTNFTKKVIGILEEAGNLAPIVFTSSTQAELQNPYGISKKNAEDALISYSKKNKSKLYIYRLPNVFGKWCRPNYNSAVATFCHNIANKAPITISNADNDLRLIYIDDVVNEFVSLITNSQRVLSEYFYTAGPVQQIKLGALAEKIRKFSEIRDTLHIPDLSDSFDRKLYATYLSYLDKNDLAYNLKVNNDNRGSLFEFIKSPAAGQIFVSKTRKGIVRGNHFHNTKVEKFCVVEGTALIRLRNILSNEVISLNVSGQEIKVVDIPPGYTHNIENTGDSEMIVIFWADEVFNPQKPDTYFLEVTQ